MIPLTWKHVDARPDPDFVVAPDERLGWARTVGLGAQHVVALFGGTFLVPVLTGFPPATTLLFDVHVGGAAPVPARGHRFGRREHRARQVEEHRLRRSAA